MIMLPVVMALAVPGALAEEVGWRGFALPRLQRQSGALIASLVIGLVWGIWHIPLLVYYGTQPAEIVLAVVGTIPIAILYTWLYNQTRGSLLLVFLFHFGQQVSQTLLGTWAGYTDEILIWAIAILMIVLPGTANLARSYQLAKQA
jgi:membrane protease YdiL (CAAX protease family)